MTDLTELLREMTDDGSTVRGDAVVFERAAAAARPLRRRRRTAPRIASATALAVVIADQRVIVGRHSTGNGVHVEVTTPPVTVPAMTAADLRDGHWALIPAAPVPGRRQQVGMDGPRVDHVWGACGKDRARLLWAPGAAYDPRDQ